MSWDSSTGITTSENQIFQFSIFFLCLNRYNRNHERQHAANHYKHGEGSTKQGMCWLKYNYRIGAQSQNETFLTFNVYSIQGIMRLENVSLSHFIFCFRTNIWDVKL